VYIVRISRSLPAILCSYSSPEVSLGLTNGSANTDVDVVYGQYYIPDGYSCSNLIEVI
jgi:hypothetical protein